ncbi:epithelial membrane protein 1 [Bombina bombina]|uniref:epithelial membrane protein 1 n=1 Tax=Bombina bombina TaxID=8345 RepID=UPI00235B2A8C|nr:epithelial membrane protein 1 [Bombina bombina]
MLVLLGGIFVVHIATTVMLFVSTISNVWLQFTGPDGRPAGSEASRGIWKTCTLEATCTSVFPVILGNEASMRAVEAFMILAIIFCCMALFAFIGQLFTLDKGCRFYITGGLMLFCWVCILIAVSIYTARFGKISDSTTYHGYCFILAWICFCLSFLVGILYLVLRKK